MKKILSIIFILVAFTSCSSDNDDNRNSVMGNWKLVRAETLQFSDADHPLPWKLVSDYSNKNIIYTFDAGSDLTISIDGKKEQHKYEKKGASIIIDDGSKMNCEINDKGELVLGLSYVDGSDLYFVRL